jgi:ATP-dependent Clp protease ATP-binding subunit ClpC
MLKPALARGELQCIGATTLNEYKKHIEKDAALERRFQMVVVDEPTVEETEEILRGLRHRYEEHHKVRYTDEALHAAAYLAQRYITQKFLPDKAIDLVDESGSRARLHNTTIPKEMLELEEKVRALDQEKSQKVNEQDYEEAARIRDDVNRLREELSSRRNTWKNRVEEERPVIGPEGITEIVCSMTGIPLQRVAESESRKLLRLEEEIHKSVVGQDEAIAAVARCIRRSRTGMKAPRRPVGSFIFLGPSGVGKSLLAKSLAQFLFGSEDALIRIDMSEFMEKHNVSRLLGAPPGYIGYDEGGQLTDRVRRRPYSVLLLDEIEKAHVDVFNILLQVLEEGQLSDNLGHVVDFRNAIVIMTSNLGARDIAKGVSLGFTGSADDKGTYARIRERTTEELKKTFNPEFLNRVDEVLVFHPLTREHLSHILDIMTAEIQTRLADRKIDLVVTDRAREHLLDKGLDDKSGARNLRRVLQAEIEDGMANELLKGHFADGGKAVVDMVKGELVFRDRKSKETAKAGGSVRGEGRPSEEPEGDEPET